VEPHTHLVKQRRPMIDFLVVIMASGIARGRVCMMTTVAMVMEPPSCLAAIGNKFTKTYSLGL